MNPHDLYLALQQWWLDAAAGPQLLFGFRIVSGALAVLATVASALNAAHPNELEHTWDREDCRRFQVLAWIRVIGCLCAAAYFLSAATFEVDRTSSPHRLLMNNLWASLILGSIALDAVAWRFHYLRKRMLLHAQGEDVKVKP